MDILIRNKNNEKILKSTSDSKIETSLKLKKTVLESLPSIQNHRNTLISIRFAYI